MLTIHERNQSVQVYAGTQEIDHVLNYRISGGRNASNFLIDQNGLLTCDRNWTRQDLGIYEVEITIDDNTKSNTSIFNVRFQYGNFPFP